MYARERLDEAGEAARARRASRALGARARRARARARRGSTATRRTCARRSTCCSRASPPPRSRLCVALSPFWLRRIELRRGATPLRRRARRRAGADAAAGRGAARGRGDRLPRAARSHAGMALAEESHAVAVEIGDARSEWRALQFLGELGVAGDDDRRRHSVAGARARARAVARASRAAEALGIHSLGVAHWMRGDLRERRPAPRRERRGVPRARALVRDGSRRRSTSPRSGRACRRSRPGCSTSSRTR